MSYLKLLCLLALIFAPALISGHSHDDHDYDHDHDDDGTLQPVTLQMPTLSLAEVLSNSNMLIRVQDCTRIQFPMAVAVGNVFLTTGNSP